MNELINYLIALPLAFLANVVLGAEVGRIKEQFSKTVLVNGLIKGALMYVSIGLLVGIVYFIPDLQVNIDGTNIGVVQALTVLILGGIMWYVVGVLQKLAVLLKGEERKIEVIEDAGTPELDEVELG